MSINNPPPPYFPLIFKFRSKLILAPAGDSNPAVLLGYPNLTLKASIIYNLLNKLVLPV